MDNVSGLMFVALSAWAGLAAWCHWRQGTLERRIRESERDAMDREAEFEAAMTDIIRALQNDTIRTLKHVNRRVESLELRSRALGRAHQPMPTYTAVPDPNGEVH